MIAETFRAFADFRLFFYGLVLVIMIAIRPKGLLGSWELTPDSVKKLIDGFKLKK